MIKNNLLKLHHFLIPQERNLGYLPYVWLSYLGIYFFNFAFSSPDTFEIVVSILAVTLFLILYFSTFRRSHNLLLLHIFAIYMIGASMAFINFGSSVFFVFAASFCSQIGKPKKAITLISIIVTLIAFQSFLFQFSVYFYLPAIFFSLLVGLSNIYFFEMNKKNQLLKASQEEVQQLATIAERERIARDLHDLIGHTFSLITVKAELARKLVSKDPQRAEQEIQQIEKTSREALSQVREAVSGYSKLNFHNEVVTARVLCQSADIEFSDNVTKDNLPESLNESFAYIIREAVTNIVRHSNASACSISLEKNSDMLTLVISDNGHFTQDAKDSLTLGNGLTGMKQRIDKANGSFSINLDNGFSIMIKVKHKDIP